jgi:DNA-binding transcriptional regulator of glucitol operon
VAVLHLRNLFCVTRPWVRRWLSIRAFALHLSMVVWTAGCGVAAWWQVGRAEQGNQFSYLYAIEWPVFGIAGIFCWWAMLHTDDRDREERDTRRAELDRVRAASHTARRDRSAEDPELAAYNDQLAALAASGRRKTWRR